MCGIFGYIGNKNNAAQIVLNGLKKLEYRGYDSWGIGVEAKEKFAIDKHAGKISVAKTSLPQSNFAFGHTRWATHGGVTDLNAHPHLDCTGKLAVVHNGIIENFTDIKKLLGKKHKIVSETDTELAAHLIEEYRRKYPLVEAVRQAFLKFRGLSALLIADIESKTLVAIKNGSPLVVGVGKNENMIGSDVNCLLNLTDKVIFLEDNQMATITQKDIALFDVQTGETVKSKVQKITWKQTVATKGKFPHFMLKEINEQPRVIENILHNFDERITKFANLFSAFPKIYLVGCGTAYYAAETASYMLSKIAQKEVIPVAGSEFIYKEPFLNQETLVVFLSQSGETIDIIEPLKRVKEKKVKTAALVNVFGSSLYRLSDEKIWLEAGPEICVVSTKAFAAKVAVLGLLSFQLAGQKQLGQGLLSQTIKEQIKILQKDYQKNLEFLAKILSKHEHIYILGRGICYPLVKEVALKIKEVSYLHAEGFSGGELKHGPIALIEPGTPCLVFVPQDETYESVISNAMEVKARGGYLIGVSQKKEKCFDAHIPVGDFGIFTVLPMVMIAQLLGYKLALLKERDPDKPRNLAKSVTVK